MRRARIVILPRLYWLSALQRRLWLVIENGREPEVIEEPRRALFIDDAARGKRRG